jgi:hypothetical protein
MSDTADFAEQEAEWLLFAALCCVIARAGLVVRRTALDVFFRRNRQIGFLTSRPLLVKFPQKWHAPLATGACAQTLAQLRCNLGFFALQVVHQFALTHAEAQANVVVGLHDVSRSAVRD